MNSLTPADITQVTAYPWGNDIFACPKPFYVSHSSLGLFDGCSRKFELQKFYEPKDREVSLATEIGHALHIGWQIWMDTEDKQASDWAYAKRYPLYINADPLDKRSLEAGMSVLDELRNNYKMAEYKLAKIVDKEGQIRPAVEVEFEIWIDGPRLGDRVFVYRGFIDAILQHVVTGEFLVVDLKTHRQFEYHPEGEFKFHGQTLPYGLVIEAAIGKPIKSFKVAYLCAFIDILEPKVVLYNKECTQADIQGWAHNLWFKLQMMRTYFQYGTWPRTTHGCVSWSKPCRFLGICEETRPEVLQQRIDAMPENPWSQKGGRPPQAWVRYIIQLPENL